MFWCVLVQNECFLTTFVSGKALNKGRKGNNIEWNTGNGLGVPDITCLQPTLLKHPLNHFYVSFFILINTLCCCLHCCHIVLQVPTHEICSALLSPLGLFQHKCCPYVFSSFLVKLALDYFSPHYEAFFFWVASNWDFYLIFQVLWIVQCCDRSTNTFLFFFFFLLTEAAIVSWQLFTFFFFLREC